MIFGVKNDEKWITWSEGVIWDRIWMNILNVDGLWISCGLWKVEWGLRVWGLKFYDDRCEVWIG